MLIPSRSAPSIWRLYKVNIECKNAFYISFYRKKRVKWFGLKVIWYFVVMSSQSSL